MRRIGLSLLSWIAVGCLLVLTHIGQAAATETVFPGGTLAELQALSPTLTFDTLRITGTLSLPAGGAATLKVNQLTITASGGVGYTYGTCIYLPAPDFTVQATGKVVVNGNIGLVGRYGTRTLSSSTCNQCGGQPGGDVRITADEITLTGDIYNNGGDGGISVSDGSCSSGCSGGHAGGIYLNARHLTVSTAKLATYGAPGGTGHCYGSASVGATGNPGPVQLNASDLFKVSESTVSTDGVVTLTAAQTDIYGPITGSQLNATIGGHPDTQGPQVSILSPLPNSVVPLGEPLQVRIQAKDLGSGTKDIQVDGLGYSHLHTADQMVNGVLAITIPKALLPATLTVTARDNSGNTTTASVTELSLAGNLTIPEGEDFTLSGDYLLGPESALTVSGNLIIKQGISAKITGASLTVTDTGVIKDEDGGPRALSLEIAVRGAATIDGTIDLSINDTDHWVTLVASNITIRAAGISVGGNLKANGQYNNGWDAGSGGTIALISSLYLDVQGSLSAKGANAKADYWMPCCRGGDGGKIELSYLTLADTTGATFDVSAGTGKYPGVAGAVASSWLGGPDAERETVLPEVEPNSSPATAQWLLPPVRVAGSVTPADEGTIQSGGDDFEDVYVLHLQTPIAVYAALKSSAADVDLDLVIAKAGSLTIVAESRYRDPGGTEVIPSVDLEPGDYLIFVSQYGEVPAVGSDYFLWVLPASGQDSDHDGLADWWEKTHFGSLDRSGNLDADNDGLADRDEYARGTDPLVADTDGDGMPDGWEVQHGFDPLVNDAGSCAGDCNADSTVTVGEIMEMVDIALGQAPLDTCMPGDTNADGKITIDELLAAVSSALESCSGAGGCQSNADCAASYPYCGPDGGCWSDPCAQVCSGGDVCCGGDYPYCGPDDSCWNGPCSTLCGDTCCGPTEQCQAGGTCS